MAILTTSEVLAFTDITATAGTIVSRKYIEEVQERIVLKTNNYFVTDLYLQDYMDFYASNNSIIAVNSFEDENFAAGDDIYIYHSYRNDGYFTISTVSGTTLVLTSAASVVEELSGRSILVSVVKWPLEIKKIAANMVCFDHDFRPGRATGLKSRTLGPLIESYFGETEVDSDGYPVSITRGLSKYTIARFM